MVWFCNRNPGQILTWCLVSLRGLHVQLKSLSMTDAYVFDATPAKWTTVEQLHQQYIFIPAKVKVTTIPERKHSHCCMIFVFGLRACSRGGCTCVPLSLDAPDSPALAH